MACGQTMARKSGSFPATHYTTPNAARPRFDQGRSTFIVQMFADMVAMKR